MAAKSADAHCRAARVHTGPMTDIPHFDSRSLEELVASGATPVLVEFGAPWCAPCLAMSPALNDLAREFAGVVHVGRVNVEEDPGALLAARHEVHSIPTLVLFGRDGAPLARVVGFQPAEALKRWLAQELRSCR